MEYIDAKKIACDVCKVLPNGEQKDVVVYYAIQAAMAAAEQAAKNSNSLQEEQPEVDLEKEVEKYYYDRFDFISSANNPTLDILTDIANHFYKLGLKQERR